MRLIRWSSENTSASSSINGRRVTLFDQHFRKPEPDQDGDLFLGSHAEMMKGFLVSGLS